MCKRDIKKNRRWNSLIYFISILLVWLYESTASLNPHFPPISAEQDGLLQEITKNIYYNLGDTPTPTGFDFTAPQDIKYAPHIPNTCNVLEKTHFENDVPAQGLESSIHPGLMPSKLVAQDLYKHGGPLNPHHTTFLHKKEHSQETNTEIAMKKTNPLPLFNTHFMPYNSVDDATFSSVSNEKGNNDEQDAQEDFQCRSHESEGDPNDLEYRLLSFSYHVLPLNKGSSVNCNMGITRNTGVEDVGSSFWEEEKQSQYPICDNFDIGTPKRKNQLLHLQDGGIAQHMFFKHTQNLGVGDELSQILTPPEILHTPEELKHKVRNKAVRAEPNPSNENFQQLIPKWPLKEIVWDDVSEAKTIQFSGPIIPEMANVKLKSKVQEIVFPSKKRKLHRRVSTQHIRNETKLSYLADRGLREMGMVNSLSECFSILLDEVYQVILQTHQDSEGPWKRSLEDIKNAITRTKPLVIDPFFGGLVILYSMGGGRISKHELIREGTIFLKNQLNQWRNFPTTKTISLDHEKWKIETDHSNGAESLLTYLMDLSHRGICSMATIWKLLRSFLIMFCGERGLPCIIDFTDFTHKCGSMYQESKTNSMWLTNLIMMRHELRSSSTQENPSHPLNDKINKLHLLKDSPRKKKLKQSVFLRRAHPLQVSPELTLKIHEYFDELAIEWESNLQYIHDMREEVTNTIEDCETPTQLVQRGIHMARNKITSTFFYLLGAYHHEKEPFPSIELTNQYGWKFLKDYFSRWKNVIIPYPFPQIYKGKSSVGRPCGKHVDWSNTKEVVHFFIRGNISMTPPNRFAIHLIEQLDDGLEFHKHVVTDIKY